MSSWTQSDVEEFARAYLEERMPSDEAFANVGSEPPSEFFEALGQAVLDIGCSKPVRAIDGEEILFDIYLNGSTLNSPAAQHIRSTRVPDIDLRRRNPK